MANDHYVPRFYLRGFEIPTKLKWIYSYRRKLKPKAIAIKSVASEEGYYRIVKEDLMIPEDTVDKIFTIIEDKAAPLISKIRTEDSLYLSMRIKSRKKQTNQEFGRIGLWNTNSSNSTC